MIRSRIEAALADAPVVLLNGARQTGKTTLVESVVAGRPGAVYRTLDDAATLAAAAADPNAFVRQPGTPLVIDEVQRVPSLFPALKLAVDRKRRPGRYLLTGSANVLLLPRLAESLTGRMEVIVLDPLAQSELEGRQGSVMDWLFEGDPLGLPVGETSPSDLVHRVLKGGYPEALGRSSEPRRDAWFGAYVTTILQRDVRDLAHIEGLTEMPRLLALLAARTACLLNVAELSRATAIPHNTLKRYLALLETTFLVTLLPAWTRDLGKRLAKAPRLHLSDTGLAAHTLGFDAARVTRDGTTWGRLLESFVAGELRKHTGWSRTAASLYHFRTAAGQETDLAIENRQGRLVGVEVKASATLRAEDFAGLQALAALVGGDWLCGVVFYTGSVALPFGDRLYGVPIAALWAGEAGS